MSLKSKIKKLLPSFRNKDEILGDMGLRQSKIIEEFKKCFDALNERNEYLFWLSQIRENETIFDTKKRVFLNIPKAEGDLRCVQLGSNYILQRIRTLSIKKGLTFWLFYGTLLGSVRHHGFIPWDDDIDIGIMREDFSIFKQMIDEDNELEINYYYIYTGEKTIKIKHKESDVFWVDLFLFDRVDVDDASMEKTSYMIKKEYLNMREEVKNLLKSNGFDMTKKDIACKKIDLEFDEIFNRHKNNLPFYGHGNSIVRGFDNYSSGNFPIYRESDFLPLNRDGSLYEGIAYYSVNNPDIVLRKDYGDYWEFPKNFGGHYRPKNDLRKEYKFLKDKNILF